MFFFSVFILQCSTALIHQEGGNPLLTHQQNQHHGGHGNVHGLDSLSMILRDNGIRLVDGKDREGADDVGNDSDFLPDLDSMDVKVYRGCVSEYCLKFRKKFVEIKKKLIFRDIEEKLVKMLQNLNKDCYKWHN